MLNRFCVKLRYDKRRTSLLFRNPEIHETGNPILLQCHVLKEKLHLPLALPCCPREKALPFLVREVNYIFKRLDVKFVGFAAPEGEKLKIYVIATILLYIRDFAGKFYIYFQLLEPGFYRNKSPPSR